MIESELRVVFAELAQTDGIARVFVSRTGTILNLNGEAETLLGYPRDELLHLPVEALIPERFRRDHPALRDAYDSDPHLRQPEGRQLFARHCDGSDLPVEIGLLPVSTSVGVYTLVTLRVRLP
jgi:PAS domain S-box-containing protein